MAFEEDENRLSPYRKFLVDLSSHLLGKDLEALKFAALEFIPRRITENISSGLKFFDVLEQDERITPRDLSLLVDMFKTVGRMDLAWKVQCFSTSPANNDIDGIQTQVVTDGNGNATMESSLMAPGNTDNRDTLKRGHPAGNGDNEDNLVTDGSGLKSESHPIITGCRMAEHADKGYEHTEDVVTDGGGNESESDPTASGSRSVVDLTDIDESQVIERASASSAVSVDNQAITQQCSASDTLRSFAVTTRTLTNKSSGGNDGSSFHARGPAPAACSQAQAGHGRLQHVGQPPVRYVNYLAYQGYSVEIIGGKHFKTPEGEFVEMKSGTQYKIHVKNSRPYGCNLDISIDGYDVGGWVVGGGQEFTIERSAYEAKKFTFYRVKTAPKEAGIESGRSENGVVKCVFTPEAFLDIPVVIPGLLQPLVVNMAPNGLVGELKFEVQRQLNATPDPDQILVLNGKILSNSARLSNVVKSRGNLRLIDVELEITVETSSNVIFPIKIQPGKAKVLDLMDQIQRKLDVPIKDQKLYHGRSRLSDEPRRGLSLELICSFQPTVVVIVPEYILVTVEDVISGDSSIVKIDKEKTLKDLVKEIPSCRNMPENKEAMFYYNEKELCPSRDDETLTNLGIFSGAKLELKMTIVYIEINVAGWPGTLSTLSIGIRCNPQDTFKDLLNKLEARCNTGKLQGATFLTGQRVFDPEQDQSPLQDYDINHGSALVIKLAETQSNFERGNAPCGVENGQMYAVSHRIQYRKRHHSDDEDDEDEAKRKQIAEAAEWGEWGVVPLCSGITLPGEGALSSYESGYSTALVGDQARILNANDPAWKAGGTTLQGHSTQQFMAADPIKVDHSKEIELVLRLVAREDETDLVFPKDEFQPLSTLYPPAVPE